MVKRGKALRIVVAHEKLTKVLQEKVKRGGWKKERVETKKQQ